MKNPFIAAAVLFAAFAAASRENAYRDFIADGGKPRRHHEPGAYGAGLRKSFTAKNLARRANGEPMVA